MFFMGDAMLASNLINGARSNGGLTYAVVRYANDRDEGSIWVRHRL
jgi:hypothetical protein